EAYKVAMLGGNPLDAIRGFYMATPGGARALRLEDTIGSIRPGYEADLAVVDLKATEFLEWRLQFADTIPEKLFVLQTLAPDNLIRATYVAGKKVFDRQRAHSLVYSSELPL
ncbi:MAG: amidohydrolase family protein, partial [Muribaculaceae bacterium]|nr:amidohydrolase family protein [Muribaculaceae bacterium]